MKTCKPLKVNTHRKIERDREEDRKMVKKTEEEILFFMDLLSSHFD